MKLHTYMSQKGLTDAAMAALVGNTTSQAINRYRRGRRFPRPQVMIRIAEVTEGAVQPNDFFEADPDPADGAPPGEAAQVAAE